MVTNRAVNEKTPLILSLFPGIGLLDKAFEETEYCVVRGPDQLWGGDIRQFNPPPHKFWGIIGGSPCQEFSGLRRKAPTGYGEEMLEEYKRVVYQSQPEWWLLENVARVPNVTIPGYYSQRIDLNQGWYSDTLRLRHIQFGSLSGRLLNIPRGTIKGQKQKCVVANDNRTFAEMCKLQGLPSTFKLPGFTVKAKKQAIGNGVPLILGKILAEEIKRIYQQPPPPLQYLLDGTKQVVDRCACGCGRSIKANEDSYDEICRKRLQRQRQRQRKQQRDQAVSHHYRNNG